MLRDRFQLPQLLESCAAETRDFFGSRLTDPHPFMARLFKTMGWQAQDLLNFVHQGHAKLARRCASGEHPAPRIGGSALPKNCHKIWLTSPDTPHMPPEDFLAAYLAMCGRQPGDWTQWFWSNSEAVLQHVSTQARAVGAKVLAAPIDGIALGPIGSTLQKLIDARKYVLAADILKIVVLDRYGGIYSDLGICFDDVVLEIAVAADYTFLFASNLFFQTSWLSMAPHSTLSSVFLGVMNYPEVLSKDYVLDETKLVNPGTEVHSFAGLGYSACALLFMPRSAAYHTFPESSTHISWDARQSWYGDKPKFGNVLIGQSLPTILKQEKYREYELEARDRLRSFNADGRLHERANVLVKLFEYFLANPPRLSRAFVWNGSDKVGGWHNFGYVYSLLLDQFAERGFNLMEVGDGSSLWGPAAGSGDGYLAGGSMQAWKDAFNVNAVGVEIDRSAGQGFSLSHPVIVNRSEKSTLQEQLNRQHYDVIIDNGFHDFEASTALLQAALAKPQAPGLYFIEAVQVADTARWENYLSAIPNASLFVSFPSPVNYQDNCMVMVVMQGGADVNMT